MAYVDVAGLKTWHEVEGAVLPGTHAVPVESADAVNALIVSWLRGDPATFDWR